ncbi:MAG: hypothetical protein RIF41_19990, partial [Polyangiaceae bacterium]
MEVKTEAERARICETLVNAAGLEGLWSWVALEEAIRPVFAGDEPRPSYHNYAAPWSSGQARMVALAWSVWNGGVPISFDELLFGLDARLRALVAELLLTESSSAWLDSLSAELAPGIDPPRHPRAVVGGRRRGRWRATLAR